MMTILKENSELKTMILDVCKNISASSITNNNVNQTSFINEIKGTDNRGTNFIEYNDKGGEIYVSFQVILRFLNEYVNLNSNGKPIIKIDLYNSNFLNKI